MGILALEGDRFAEFRDVARDAVVAVDVRRASGEPFGRFRYRELSLSHMRLCDFVCDPVVIERSRRHIARDGVDDAILIFQMAGEVWVRQQGKEFTLRGGDLAMVAADQPYLVAYRRPSRRLFLRIPGRDFRRKVAVGGGPATAQFLGNTALGRIVSSLFNAIAVETQALEEADGEMIAENLLDLVGILLRRSQGDAVDPPPLARAARVDHILAYMDRHFSDPDLGPERIARANGISTRYLHALFGCTGTTVNKWLWERRLAACREALADPRQVGQSICEIAYRHGFSDAAHFSRSFRKRFNATPREVRAKPQRAPTRRPAGRTPGRESSES